MLKLRHIRHLDSSRGSPGEPFVSVTHFGYRDPTATTLAKTIREEIKVKVRVVTDQSSGLTHVFVPVRVEDEVVEIVSREGF